MDTANIHAGRLERRVSRVTTSAEGVAKKHAWNMLIKYQWLAFASWEAGGQGDNAGVHGFCSLPLLTANCRLRSESALRVNLELYLQASSVVQSQFDTAKDQASTLKPLQALHWEVYRRCEIFYFSTLRVLSVPLLEHIRYQWKFLSKTVNIYTETRLFMTNP